MKVLTDDFCKKNNIDETHSLEHYKRVMYHADMALKECSLNDNETLAVLVASFLHDVDDKKYMNTVNYENARMIISDTFSRMGISFDSEWVELVIKMIDLVSCSKNGNSDVEKKWMLIPRIADRIDALGYIGIERVVGFGKLKNRPMHTINTIRVYNKTELNKVATLDRFNLYVKHGRGVDANKYSTIDHIYDKLIHIGRPEYFGIDNEYFTETVNKEREIIEDYVINYWKDIQFDEIMSKLSNST